MSSQFKRLKSKAVLNSRVFEVREELWQMPVGKRTRHTVVHPGAVAILPFDSKGRMLMIRQFRPAANTVLLEIPAGTLEKGEKPLVCAKRELIEEIGFSAKKWQRLGAVFTAPGFCTELIHLYKATMLKPAFAEKDEDEEIEVVAMSMKEVRDAVRNNNICDAKTLSALMFLNVLG
jgi:ADP-ribose pyrophosphatase